MVKISKAQRIRALYAQGKTCREIADIVGCRPEYARVCAQQRVGGADSNADTAYAIRSWGSIKAYNDAKNAKTRDYRSAYYRKRRERARHAKEAATAEATP